MQIYTELYYYLFNRITDALSALEERDIDTACAVLIEAQREAEEKYIEAK